MSEKEKKRARSPSRSRSKERRKKPKKDKKRKKEKKREKKRKDEAEEKEQSSTGKDKVESMSVEETNKLRISMGLKPLATPNSEGNKLARAADVEQNQKAVDAKKSEEQKLIAKRKKRERDLQSKIDEDVSLGKSLQTSTGGSAADWVKRSRKLDKAAKLAQKRQFVLDQQEAEAVENYESENLSGLKIAHDVTSFRDGTTTILTLKDQPILLEGVIENPDADELENVNMADADVLEQNLELKKKKPRYDLYHEGAETLLSKYDDATKREGFTLDTTGGRDEVRLKRKEAIRNKLNKPDDHTAGVKYSLNDYELKVESEYLPVAFKKKMRKKKKNGNRKKPEVIAELRPLPSVEEHMKDHGSRAARRGKQTKAEQTKALKDASYLKALNKAEKATKKILAELENVFEDEQDEELQSSLDRARRLARKKKEERKAKRQAKKEAKSKIKLEGGENDEDEDDNDDNDEEEEKAGSSAPSVDALGESIKKRREADKIKQETIKEEGAGEETGDDIKMEVSEEGLVFTATTEFCRGLQESEKVERKVKSIFKHKNKQKKKAAAAAAAQAAEAKKELDEDDSDNDSDDEEEESILNDEPLASTSLAATLQLIKSRGFLDDRVYRGQVGRAQDKEVHLDKDDPAPHIQIRHLDDFGNDLKPKQAFRVLSHTFHGRPPGLVKKEKQRQKRIADQKRQGSRVTDMTSVKKFFKRQSETGKAYVTLDRKFSAARVDHKPKRQQQKPAKKQAAGSGAPIVFDIGK